MYTVYTQYIQKYLRLNLTVQILLPVCTVVRRSPQFLGWFVDPLRLLHVPASPSLCPSSVSSFHSILSVSLASFWAAVRKGTAGTWEPWTRWGKRRHPPLTWCRAVKGETMKSSPKGEESWIIWFYAWHTQYITTGCDWKLQQRYFYWSERV